MRRSRRGALVGGFAALARALTFGGGGARPGSRGPGGAPFRGTVSTANPAWVARLRSPWLAWLGEHVLGFARPAYAQARDTSLGGITVIVRGGGREVSDLTDSSGGFVVSDAPTGEVTVLFRRGSCEGSLPIGGVVSTSTLTLVGVSFLCSPGSDVAAVSLTELGERFNGVTREN